MSEINCKCKNCKKRTVDCHSKCLSYLAFKVKMAEFNKIKREQKAIEYEGINTGWSYSRNRKIAK